MQSMTAGKVVLCFLLVLGCHSISFSQSARESWELAWLFNVPTSYVAKAGEFEIGLLSRYTNYRDTRSGVRDLIVSGDYGLSDRCTLSTWVPLSWLENSFNGFTVSDIEIFIKYQVFENKKVDIAVTPKVFLPTGNKTNLMGSGQVDLFFLTMATYRHSNLWLFGNLGVGKIGYVTTKLRHNPSGSTTRLFFVENVYAIRGMGGLSIRLHPSLWMVVEGSWQMIRENLDKDFLLQAGVILTVSPSIVLRAGTGAGIPRNEKTSIKLRALAGLCYLL